MRSPQLCPNWLATSHTSDQIFADISKAAMSWHHIHGQQLDALHFVAFAVLNTGRMLDAGQALPFWSFLKESFSWKQT